MKSLLTDGGRQPMAESICEKPGMNDYEMADKSSELWNKPKGCNKDVHKYNSNVACSKI